MLSRRKFLQGASLLALAYASRGKASIHGSASINNSRVTLNVPAGYLNLVKGFGFQPDPANQDANGYPVTAPTAAMVANTSMPSNYWGDFVLKWSGTGSIQINGGPPTIVSQSTQVSGNFQVGDSAGGNQSIVSATAPRVQFKFGVNIQALTDSGVSNGAGGTMVRVTTKTGFAANVVAGANVNVSGVVSGQTNANGTWTIATVGGNSSAFDLVGSAWNAGNGASGIGGVAAMQYTNTSIRVLNVTGSDTFSGFSNLIWCKSGDETAIANGQMTDTVLLDQLQYLCNPNNLAAPNVWLRFMDFSGAQQNWEADYAQRILPSQICYNAQFFRNAYWAGTVHNSGSDAYTCSDPSTSVWNGTSYIDNAIVQGNVDITNSGVFPTLAVGGHPAKPIFNLFLQGVGKFNYFAESAASATGQTLQFTFSASWINGGTPYVLNYTTTATGPFGSDTASANNLTNNVSRTMQNDPVLSAAGLQYGNPFSTMYVRTAQAGAMTWTQTGGQAVATFTIQTVPASSIATGNSSFMYNYLLDGWVYRSGGIVMAGPLEIAAEIANAVNAHVWWNWGTNKGSLITSVTDFFATNLDAGLKFGTEPGNELWNASAYPYPLWNTLGATLGFPVGGTVGSQSYGGLRGAQYYVLSSAAWTGAGRPASDHFLIQPGQSGDMGVNGNLDSAQLKGIYLNCSGSTVGGIVNNTIYGTYGGLNGSGAVSVNYNIAPNRPVDITGGTGCAPYWSSHWLGNGGSIAAASAIVGTVTQNAPWLQAALDYMNGNTATAFQSMVNQFTEVTTGGSGNGGYDFVDMQTTFANCEAMVAQYDGSRPAGMNKLIILDYECAPSWGTGANGIAGINSIGLAGINSSNGDVQSIAARMTALGWNVSAYTQSGTNNATEMATMAVTMFQGWKYDIDHTGAAANTGSYKSMIKTNYYAARNNHNTTRETHPAQFGYASDSQWSLIYPDYTALEKYTNYDAIHEFNAVGS